MRRVDLTRGTLINARRNREVHWCCIRCGSTREIVVSVSIPSCFEPRVRDRASFPLRCISPARPSFSPHRTFALVPRSPTLRGAHPSRREPAVCSFKWLSPLHPSLPISSFFIYQQPSFAYSFPLTPSIPLHDREHGHQIFGLSLKAASVDGGAYI